MFRRKIPVEGFAQEVDGWVVALQILVCSPGFEAAWASITFYYSLGCAIVAVSADGREREGPKYDDNKNYIFRL
jgi:hypothetical protein